MVEGENKRLRVLVVDDSRVFRRALQTELTGGGFDVLLASDGAEALTVLRDQNVDLVTLDVDMPEMDGFETCRRIRTGSVQPQVRILFVTGRDSLEDRQRGFELGASDFFHKKNFKPGQFRDAVSQLLSPERQWSGLVALVVDDSGVARRIAAEGLREQGVTVLEAADGQEALEIVSTNLGIDMVLTDQHMPRLTGTELCGKLRRDFGLADLPIIFLSSTSDRQQVLELFEAGATDYLHKPFLKEELLARLGVHLQARRLNRELRDLNAHLESRIKEATTEIRAKNLELRESLEKERWLAIEKEKMGAYIPRHVVDEISRNREQKLALGGRSVRATILFSDIQGFTRLSETMAPEPLVSFLNEYMTAMTRIVEEEHGILDKFIGDAIMAIFLSQGEADNYARRAVRCGVRMQQKLRELQAEWVVRRPDVAHVMTRVGINTGECVAGNIGSETRIDYTVIGDNVNVASRIESNGRGGEVHISESTWQDVQNDFAATRLEPIHVKNRVQPVQIYSVHIPPPGAPPQSRPEEDAAVTRS
ncbi:MAG: response regulator [Candidatus Xenobia bacterium]